ncbi:hypothetical protein [Novosphingobium sp. ST904]|uniref:hypothetical protein n=1 Tax=Novosphingobium sp. ST904 TaxID=1684385 RepID=UPI0006C871A3|nr:hypothetical protein [Novosphingobium sp. ST904]TCM39155.1 hypothetical protein EDF59_10634 [Novosphingobium sp. ST904]
MAKALRIAAMVVAIAAAIPTGGTSLLGAGLAVSASTAAMIATAVSVASSLASALMAKPPAIQGGQTEWQSDPNGPIPIVFGDTLVGGSVVYRKTGGKKNKYQFLCSVISGCGPITAIDQTLVDDTATTFLGYNAVGDLNDWVYQRTQLGACPEAAALIPTGPWTSLPGWNAASKMSGYAAAMNVFVFDGKGSHTFTQVPTIQWRVRGVKCYDPRQDSTYPGGSGTQRANDASTWAFSRNGWIQALTFALGWFQGVNEIRVGGVGMPITSIDIASFVEAANIADANGWLSGGRTQSTDTKWDVLKSLCQAGGGEPVRHGATLSAMINTPRVPIGTITRNDLIGNASVTTTQTRRDRINGIIPTYRSEDHQFAQVPAGVVRNSSYLAQDGGIERTKEITYPMVQCYAGQRPDQAAQIAGYDIANAREAGPIVFPLKLRWLGYKAGDCLSIENTPEFGYMAGKDVIVLRRQLDPDTASVVLTLRQETPGKHVWALGLTGVAAPTTDKNPVPEAAAPDATEWTYSTHVEYLGGVPTGTIELSGAVDDAGASSVLIEYRESGTTTWMQAAQLPVSATSFELMGLSVSRTYDVAVSYYSEHRLVFTGIGFDYTPAVPTATGVTASTAINPPVVSWQMPEITGWATAVVYRGTSDDEAASAAVSPPQTGGLFEAKTFEDAALTPGTYWWWVRIFDGDGNQLSISAPATGTVA